MAKAYEFSGGVVLEGIRLDSSRLPHAVGVGESGRGRKHVSVPVPEGAVIEGHEAPTPNNGGGKAGKLISAPVSGGEKAIIVKIWDHSGFRGSWDVRDPRTRDEWASRVAGTPASDIPKRPAKWRVIAEGFKAQGDAGRAGGGPEYLAVMEDGMAVEMFRTGRLYGGCSVFRLENQGGALVAIRSMAEAEQLAAEKKW